MIEDVGYLSHLDEVRWYAYTVEAVRVLNRAGFLVCVTTNQAGIARGLYTEDVLRSIHTEMDAHLQRGGASIDAWLYCPHHPNGEVAAYRTACACRKPEPGMIRQACDRFDIDLARSFVVGDKALDVESAVRAGARGILVRTGYGEGTFRSHDGHVPGAAHVAADLMAAVSWMLVEGGLKS